MIMLQVVGSVLIPFPSLLMNSPSLISIVLHVSIKLIPSPLLLFDDKPLMMKFFDSPENKTPWLLEL